MRDLSSTELLESLDGRLTARQLLYMMRRGIIAIDSPGNGSGAHHRFSPAEARAIADYVDMRDRITTGAYYAERLAHHLQPPSSTAEEIAQAIYDAHYEAAIAGGGEAEHALRFALQELIALLGAAGALSDTA